MATGRLVGKAAIVTGGGSGIGRAICRVFAREGASVAVVDANRGGTEETLKTLISSHDNKHFSYQADVSSPDQVRECMEQAKTNLGLPTVLVNNAGIIRDSILTKLTEKQFDDVINVNLKGTFLMAKEFVAALRETDSSGSIINISSISGKTGNIGQANYSASKAGVLGMSKTIALEYGKYNIRCNAVLPGFIATPMTEQVPDKVIAMVNAMIPLKRMGSPEEIANACLFLASDESSYVNGACLEVTGGLFA